MPCQLTSYCTRARQQGRRETLAIKCIGVPGGGDGSAWHGRCSSRLQLKHLKPEMTMKTLRMPSFRPLPWLRGCHAQTLAGFWMPGPTLTYSARRHRVTLPDGDRLVLHDDCPDDWQPGGATAMLVHGICGSYRSSYMERAAARLKEHGVRTFRMDQRGCGAGRGLAKRLYHAGSSSDLARALQYVGRICPASSTSVIGYSLGGNIVLKLAGESHELLPRNVSGVMAVNPAIDLAAAAAAIQGPGNSFYHRYFMKYAIKLARALPGYATGERSLPRLDSLDTFNEFFYTRIWRFGTLKSYYEVCSAAPHLSAIRVPTLIVASEDDPIVPIRSFLEPRLSPSTQLLVTERGGHLGFIGRAQPRDPDHFWIDWRMLDWVKKCSVFSFQFSELTAASA